jgi:hypothetical protein
VRRVQRTRRRPIEARKTSLGASTSLRPEPANRPSPRSVALGVIVYCAIAWVVAFQVIGIGVKAIKGEPAHYAQDGAVRLD